MATRWGGTQDGPLDAQDGLIFWSEAHEDRYTDEETYFLVPTDGVALQVGELDASPGPTSAGGSAQAHARAEDQTLYLPGVLNGVDDNFVGAYVFDAPVEIQRVAKLALAGLIRV